MNNTSAQRELLFSQQNQAQESRKKQAKSNTFMQKVQAFVIIFTVIMAGSAAVFIEVTVFFFAVDAYNFIRAQDIEIDVILKLLILLCKYLMLVMFITALIAGSLLPLALMYIILSPSKKKQE